MDLQGGHPEAARSRVEAALKGGAGRADVLTLAGQTYAAIGDSARAEQELQRALEADANDLAAYSALGKLYLDRKDTDRAIGEFEKIADRQPKSVQAQTVIAMLLESQGKVADAQARYQRALDLDSRAAVAANNLAWLYAEHDGNLDVALQLAQTAKSQLPDQPEVNDTLGWIYQKKGLSALAVPYLEDASRRVPSNTSYALHLGMAYASSHRPDDARRVLQNVLRTGTPAEQQQAQTTLGALKP